MRYSTALLAGVSVCAWGSPVVAQSAQPSVQQQEAQIVVTGSRTVRNGDNSPTPVTVVSTEVLTNLKPGSLTESVLALPVFSGSRGAFSNPGATGGVSGGNGNAAQLNLRNLGGQRNLVLMSARAAHLLYQYC